MNKIWLILQREYLVRVKKRSFIIMTILGPLLIGGVYGIPVWLAIREDDSRTIEVIDEAGLFSQKFEQRGNLTFVHQPDQSSLEEAKQAVRDEKYYALLYIPKTDVNNPEGIRLYAKKSVSLEVENAVERRLSEVVENKKLLQAGIDKRVLDKINTNVRVDTLSLSDEAEKDSNAALTYALGFLGAFLIYLSIFIYGVQVMRGVLEEKTNRIVEVVISSVKPIQLMLGKIIGIGLVGLTQFILWIILSTVVLVGIVSSVGTDKAAKQQAEQVMQQRVPAEVRGDSFGANLQSAINTISFSYLLYLLSTFLFYFLGGYLLYSALFAAVGAAADSETDTQQFMLPVTIPLILAFVVAQAVIRNPDGSLAFWLSMIPLTSPIIMMVRVPFGVPVGELLASMALLLLGFLGVAWVAARIYRVGILMYGKKTSYKELAKWLFYKA